MAGEETAHTPYTQKYIQKYMRTSIREHKKIRRLNGRLWRRCPNATFFMEDSLLHVRSSMFCLSFPYIPINIVHSAKIEIRQCLKDHEVVAYQ